MQQFCLHLANTGHQHGAVLCLRTLKSDEKLGMRMNKKLETRHENDEMCGVRDESQ